MLEILRKQRNKQRLTEIYSKYVDKYADLLNCLEKTYGYKPRMQDAWRSLELQRKYWSIGKSWLKVGAHNFTLPGERKAALAADILNDRDPLGKNSIEYWAVLAIEAHKRGLETGICWNLKQGPGTHRAAMETAIAAGSIFELARLVDIDRGQDPCHVQAQGWQEIARGGTI